MNSIGMRALPRRSLVFGLSAVAAALLTAAPSSAAPSESTLRQETEALVDTGLPGVVVLIRTPSRITRIAAGVDLVTSRRPMLAGDRFRVGSITKSFVAALVLRLAEDRRLSLDDSVSQWVPEFVPNGNAITVRHLLQHTSVLFDYSADPATFAPFATDPSHAWRPRDLVSLSARHPPSFAPGRGWAYSNTNYVLLGLIVEAATGKSVGAELERRLFRPLRLWATTFDTDGRFENRSNRQRPARFAHGYSTIDGRTFDASDLSPSCGYAAGAITSTADDVATFYGALMRGKLISARSLKAMTAGMRVGPKVAYGLGLQRVKLPCGSFWGHDGGTFGYTSNAFVSADGTRVAVVLANEGPLGAAQHGELNRLAARAACETGS